MDDLAKVVQKYKAWKTSINQCLVHNYDDIVSLIRGSFGQDIFIETVIENTPMGRIIKKGVIVNSDPSGQGYLVWFFHENTFYLIEKPGNVNNININPYFHNLVSINPQFSRQLRANSENEVDFLLMLSEWSEVLIPHLKARMENSPASDITGRIKKLTEAFPSV
ncbi:hypothetical protein ACK31Z_22140 [Aeromonas dhakensis]|uniref:hypothetical protein n=1 Tax=Aeromonas dhakensis TaxID=196024 RepID=UPI00244CE778|nr:hypothetical protein [Aeromonas dhakensis]MDH0177300.1 hypothetical protein [Aeromonas dhakensis]